VVDINTLKGEIVEHLKPLQPEKILLFGSFAYGQPNDESDIDLFIIKNLPKEELRDYKLKIRRKVRDLIAKYRIGFDIIVASEEMIKDRDDYFYRVELKKKAKVLYE
jgi:predicted nucleotidyltransferase